MLGKCVELLVNLPSQSKGNIGEVIEVVPFFYSVEMIDGSQILVMAKDVKVCD